MKTFSIHTLGCKVNQYESDKIRSILSAAGFLEVGPKKEADIQIINTCSVTSIADAKARQLIHKAVNLKGEVYVTGCSTKNPESKVISDSITIVPNEQKIEFFKKIGDSHKKQLDLAGIKSDDCPHDLITYNRSRPLVHIQNGCIQHCSYCIVPSLRGKQSVSKVADEALDEVRNIVNSGYGEIVLTGINIGLYNHNGFKLSDLIYKINEIKGDFRIRISSIELNTITPPLIENIFNKKVANHLHIPLQSGSNKILKSMNRPYEVEDFYKKVESLREKDPDIAITTDCIVGFPGETNDDFKKTIEAVKKINFAKVHVFRYSPRPMTASASFKQDVSEVDKKKRSNELQVIAESLRNDFLKSQKGKEVQVLGERIDNGYISGLSGNYIKVKFKGREGLLKRLASVKMSEISQDYCFGELNKKNLLKLGERFGRLFIL